MKKHIIPILFVAVVASVAMAGAGLWWFQRKILPVTFTQDAVQVIAYEAGDMFEENPGATPDEVAERIRGLHDASVINVALHPDGEVVDLFGTAFRVESRSQAGESVVTVASAGPDGKFGTHDDITISHAMNPASQSEEDEAG